ncbi:hypothetical protein D3C84_1069140 [compost metagenome]
MLDVVSGYSVLLVLDDAEDFVEEYGLVGFSDFQPCIGWRHVFLIFFYVVDLAPVYVCLYDFPFVSVDSLVESVDIAFAVLAHSRVVFADNLSGVVGFQAGDS